MEKFIDASVERGVLLVVFRKHGETIAGVVDDVYTRRVATTLVHGVRVSDRHVFVDQFAAFESLAELGDGLAALVAVLCRCVQLGHRAAVEGGRKLKAERESVVGLSVVTSGNPIVDAATRALDGRLDALVLAGYQRIPERSVRLPFRAVPVRMWNSHVFTRSDADRDGESGRNVEAVDGWVWYRVRRVYDHSGALSTRQRRVG